MMIKLYILKSLKSGIHYVGITSNLEGRIKEHNNGKSKFTKGHIPWEIIYIEEYGSFDEARRMEKYYKSSAGRRKLKQKGIIE